MRCGPERAMTSSFLRSLSHTQRRNIVGMTPLDERSVRCRDLYLTKHNTHNRQPCPPTGFEHTISADEQRQTYALDREATETSEYIYIYIRSVKLIKHCKFHIYIVNDDKVLTKDETMTSCNSCIW
jgi:hypothetical protein